MTASRGVTIMKNVTSDTSRDHEGALADLLASLDAQAGVLEKAIDHLWSVERIDRRHVTRLREQMLPAFWRRRIDVVDHDVAAWSEYARKLLCVQIDDAQLELDERIGREDRVHPVSIFER